MVDDSSADRTLCRVLLAEEYGTDLDFLEAPDARRGLELCKPLPDCLLLDYKLPDMTGVEFLRRLGQRACSESAQPADLPGFAVVMLTGLGNEQVAAEAMRAGAQDYLVKDRITSEGLRLAIEKATGKVGLLQALQAERDRLAQLLTEKEALLAEKDALLEELHHRVKNNLQVISSLLRLQAENFAENFNDARLSAVLRDSQNRVESMALIHEQLYQARNLREVDLSAHAALLANHLMHAYGVDPGFIQCRLNIAKLPVGVDRAIPAALILNELISNALKHAFPGGRPGLIEIYGGLCEGVNGGGYKGVTGGPCSKAIVIEVRDNGVGLPPAAGLEPSHTLGLNIVRILARQLRGAFTIGSRGSEDRTGTACRLTFPEHGASREAEQRTGGNDAYRKASH